MYSYSAKFLNSNSIRIRPNFWNRIVFVFVFGPENTIRSPLLYTAESLGGQSLILTFQWELLITFSMCVFCFCTLFRVAIYFETISTSFHIYWFRRHLDIAVHKICLLLTFKLISHIWGIEHLFLRTCNSILWQQHLDSDEKTRL